MYTTLSRNLVASAILLVTGCGVAVAGNGNTITIEQTNTGSVTGNSLTVDQSLANGSVIGGANLNDDNQLVLTTTAKQTGSGNTADLTIKDSINVSGGHIGLYQDNSSLLNDANAATVLVTGDGVGLVSQTGGSNTANLLVSGLGATGSIYQYGYNNKVGSDDNPGLTVSGDDAHGSITQNGSNNKIGLGVLGAGTSVTYVLNGNDVTNTANAQSGLQGGVQVISNGATVTITQTTLP